MHMRALRRHDTSELAFWGGDIYDERRAVAACMAREVRLKAVQCINYYMANKKRDLLRLPLNEQQRHCRVDNLRLKRLHRR